MVKKSILLSIAYGASLFCMENSEVIEFFPSVRLYVENESNHPVDVFFNAGTNIINFKVDSGFMRGEVSGRVKLSDRDLQHDYKFTETDWQVSRIVNDEPISWGYLLPDYDEIQQAKFSDVTIRCAKTYTADDKSIYKLIITMHKTK